MNEAILKEAKAGVTESMGQVLAHSAGHYKDQSEQILTLTKELCNILFSEPGHAGGSNKKEEGGGLVNYTQGQIDEGIRLSNETVDVLSYVISNLR